MLLVLLLGGGAYGAWWYNQQQYYVGVQNGLVSIFQGTNQTVAGINLSKLLTPSTLEVSKLGLDDQGQLSQTISKGSVKDAQALIDTLAGESVACQRQWMTLVAWQAKSVAYQKYRNELVKVEHSKPKIKVPPVAAPGPLPTAPNIDDCAPASAFAIQASALPGPNATTPTPAPSPTVRPSSSSSPTVKPSVKATSTAKKKSPASTAAG